MQPERKPARSDQINAPSAKDTVDTGHEPWSSACSTAAVPLLSSLSLQVLVNNYFEHLRLNNFLRGLI